MRAYRALFGIGAVLAALGILGLLAGGRIMLDDLFVKDGAPRAIPKELLGAALGIVLAGGGLLIMASRQWRHLRHARRKA